jgi:nucleoside-diphosphate-sugar epimerase
MIALQKRRIALIGGAGFIGHHLALELARRGADVHVIDSLAVNNLLAFTSTASDIPNRELYISLINQRLQLLRNAGIPIYVEDARDYSRSSLVLSRIKPQVMVLLAAVAHADRSNKDPYSTFDHNLRTLENALDAARNNVEHFIYFSSSMVYGDFPNGYVSEETPCEPLGIYGALKFAGEKMVIAYRQVFDLSSTIVRPSALYGERCVSRRVGQVFIENAMQGKDLVIHGDGSERLDFTYIRDLVNGIINVIENEDSLGQTFNLTYGESRSIAEVAEIVRSYFPAVTIHYKPKDKLMPNRGTLSVEKARKLIGYDPQYPIEKGIAKYIEWYQSHLGSVHYFPNHVGRAAVLQV